MHYTSLMIISIVKLDKIYTFRKLKTIQKKEKARGFGCLGFVCYALQYFLLSCSITSFSGIPEML